MNDIDLQNEVYEETAIQQLDEALANKDWKTARLVVADLEEKGLGSTEIRRRMNLAMAEPERVIGSYTPMDGQTIDRHIHEQADN